METETKTVPRSGTAGRCGASGAALGITGRDDILITGKAILLEYSPELVRVGRDACEVSIHGAELRISAMDKMGMQIFGCIASVEFTEPGGESGC